MTDRDLRLWREAADIVERLREFADCAYVADEAAREIERLRAEVERARTVEDLWRAECLKAQQALVEAQSK